MSFSGYATPPQRVDVIPNEVVTETQTTELLTNVCNMQMRHLLPTSHSGGGEAIFVVLLTCVPIATLKVEKCFYHKI